MAFAFPSMGASPSLHVANEPEVIPPLGRVLRTPFWEVQEEYHDPTLLLISQEH